MKIRMMICPALLIFAATLLMPITAAAQAGQGQPITLTHTYAGGYFHYTFASGAAFSVSVPNGSVTNHGVRLNIGPGLVAVLYRNGMPIQYNSGELIAEDGHYHMRVASLRVSPLPGFLFGPGQDQPPQDNQDPPEELDWEQLLHELEQIEAGQIPGSLAQLFDFGELGDAQQTVFSFRIVSRPTRDIPVFNLPAGFEFENILQDGAPVSPTGQHSHRFGRDGEYLITLRALDPRVPGKTVRIDVLRTPPTIRLEGIAAGGRGGGPALVSAGEGVAFAATRNGIPVPAIGRYTQIGRYTILARDEAGNTSLTEFEIRFAFPRRLILLGVLALLVAGVAVIVHARRNISL